MNGLGQCIKISDYQERNDCNDNDNDNYDDDDDDNNNNNNKVELSLQQAVEAHRVARRRGSHIV
jgi:hypothetical protein